MSDIPGAYPSTPDETPATHRLRHPGITNIGTAQHEHHEHNKLQKAQDPRSHKHVDSGVGMFDSEPSHASTQPMSGYRSTELPTDLTGPSATQSQSHAPFAPTTTTTTDSLLTATLPAPTTAVDSLPTAPTPAPQDNSNSAPLPVGNDSHVQNSRDVFAPHPEGSDAHAQHRHDQTQPSKDVTTPYWGDLPKAMSGGIYNTVMGHGSAAEDHSQHTHLPQRSAESRGHVGGDTVDIPKGGVYNTVAGHGSHDEDNTRHSLASTGAPSGGDSTALGREQHQKTGALGMGAAAAPMMGQRLSQQAEPSGPTSSTARGMAAPQQTMPSAGAAASAIPDEARGTGQVKSTSPRAFPLDTSRQDGRRQSADDAHTRHSHIAPAAAAGAGAAAIGAAAHSTDKPKKLQKHRDTSEEPRRRSMGQSPERRTHQTEGPVTTVEGRSSSSKRRSTRADSDSTSPASTERKKHGILGIFHRHKDDKEKEKIVTKEPKAADSHHHDHHRKQEAVAGAAAGAGAYGLTKHHNDDKKEHSDPMTTKQDPYAPARSTVHDPSGRANDHATAHHAQPSSAYGALPPTMDENTARRQPSGNDAVPIPPARSEKRRSASPTTMAAMTGGSAQQPHDSVLHSHDSASRYAPGVAAGLGASVMAGQHRSPAPHTQPESASNFTAPATPFEQPRAPPSTPFDSNLAAASKTSKSARAPSPRARDTSAVSRTPPQSGVAASSSDETPYNVLSSGTPSGVKIGSRSSRGSNGSASGIADHGVPDFDQKDGHPKMLAPGVAAGAATGLAAGYAHQKHDASRDLNQPSHSSMLNPSTTQDQHRDPQSTKAGSSMLPMPIRSKQFPEPASEPTAYPAPEQAKNLSPEVMPAAYTVPTAQPTTSRFSEQSAPQAYGSRDAQQTSHHSAANPAMAAAAGAWASSAGPSSGNASAPSAGKMMHKCQHCGGENDISQEVAEIIKRMTSH